MHSFRWRRTLDELSPHYRTDLARNTYTLGFESREAIGRILPRQPASVLESVISYIVCELISQSNLVWPVHTHVLTRSGMTRVLEMDILRVFKVDQLVVR